MTWQQLLALLKSFETAEHTSLDKPVLVIFNGEFYNVDIIESLTTGDAFLTADLFVEDTNDAS